jgi:hypothetical protein
MRNTIYTVMVEDGDTGLVMARRAQTAKKAHRELDKLKFSYEREVDELDVNVLEEQEEK